jgi:hypothetical protein
MITACDRMSYATAAPYKILNCFQYGYSYLNGDLINRIQVHSTNGNQITTYQASSGLPQEAKHGAMSWFIDR